MLSYKVDRAFEALARLLPEFKPDQPGPTIDFSASFERSLRELQARLSQQGMQAAGRETLSGDGVATQFEWEHGLEETPGFVLLTPASEAASAGGDWHVTADSVHITVTFTASAPDPGTDNLSWWWAAGFTGT